MRRSGTEVVPLLLSSHSLQLPTIASNPVALESYNGEGVAKVREKSLKVVLLGADFGKATEKTLSPFFSEAGAILYVHTPSLTDTGETDVPLQTRSSFSSLRFVRTCPVL